MGCCNGRHRSPAAGMADGTASPGPGDTMPQSTREARPASDIQRATSVNTVLTSSPFASQATEELPQSTSSIGSRRSSGSSVPSRQQTSRHTVLSSQLANQCSATSSDRTTGSHARSAGGVDVIDELRQLPPQPEQIPSYGLSLVVCMLACAFTFVRSVVQPGSSSFSSLGTVTTHPNSIPEGGLGGYLDASPSPDAISPAADGTPPSADTPSEHAATGSPTLDLGPRPGHHCSSSLEESPPQVVGLTPLPPHGPRAVASAQSLSPVSQRMVLVAVAAKAHASAALPSAELEATTSPEPEDRSAPSAAHSPLRPGSVRRAVSPVRSGLSSPARRPLSSNVSFANQSSALAPHSSNLRPVSTATSASINPQRPSRRSSDFAAAMHQPFRPLQRRAAVSESSLASSTALRERHAHEDIAKQIFCALAHQMSSSSSGVMGSDVPTYMRSWQQESPFTTPPAASARLKSSHTQRSASTGMSLLSTQMGLGTLLVRQLWSMHTAPMDAHVLLRSAQMYLASLLASEVLSLSTKCQCAGLLCMAATSWLCTFRCAHGGQRTRGSETQSASSYGGAAARRSLFGGQALDALPSTNELGNDEHREGEDDEDSVYSQHVQTLDSYDAFLQPLSEGGLSGSLSTHDTLETPRSSFG